ncbi:MAG: DUF2470 domain-containing protein [Pseudomonadota bacterium]
MKQVKTAKEALRCAGEGTLEYSGGAERLAVSVASALDGAPIFRLSDDNAVLAALRNTPEVRLVLGAATVVGTADVVEGADSDALAARYSLRHGPGEGAMVRVQMTACQVQTDAGAVSVDPADLLTASNAQLVQLERRAVDHMNDDHLDAIKLYAEVHAGQAAGDWKMVSLDMEGLDMVAGDRFSRLWFDPPLGAPEEIKTRLVDLAMSARA